MYDYLQRSDAILKSPLSMVEHIIRQRVQEGKL